MHAPPTNHRLSRTGESGGGGGGQGQQSGGGGQREQRWSSRWSAYLKSLRWTPIPLGVGFALIAYQQYRRVLVRERKRSAEGEFDGPVIAKPWEVRRRAETRTGRVAEIRERVYGGLTRILRMSRRFNDGVWLDPIVDFALNNLRVSRDRFWIVQ